MCGFAGYLEHQRRVDEPAAILDRMARALAHRGPDDQGIWYSQEHGVGLGHRRLSVVDLSPEGHQPMASHCGRYVMAYNGEIYNHRELRAELEAGTREGAQGWRGHSDTEVALAAVSRWGLEAALKRFNGMFALALWDKADHVLHLARDRLGEKPLYYGWFGSCLLFGSELKALRAHPAFEGEIDGDALSLYLRYNNVPSPHSIYRNVFKLPPGCYLSIAADRKPGALDVSPHPVETPGKLAPIRYWSARKVAEEGVEHRLDVSAGTVLHRLEQALLKAVRLRMEADVPLGAFLSGGIDSSVVVALMQAQSARPIRTFSIGSYDSEYDEAASARAVAAHLGTDHTQLYVSPQEAMRVIPRLPQLYDEPFADPSQIPTFLVSQLARQHVTVSLSGDGGDELFGGYNRHFWGRSIWTRIRNVPAPIRRVASRALMALSPETWNAVFQGARPLLPGRFREGLPGHKLHKLAGVLAVRSPEEMYLGLVSNWTDPWAIVAEDIHPHASVVKDDAAAAIADFTEKMMLLDLVNYLADDILVKVDRASMGVSLEARVPYLDPEVVEFAWRIPLPLKIRDGQGKWILRQLLYKYVPQELVDRPKQGFGLPIGDWLRGPLRDWAESLLDEDRLRREGHFRPGPIRQAWRQHLSGRRNAHYRLWSVLMFQSWLEEQGRDGTHRGAG